MRRACPGCPAAFRASEFPSDIAFLVDKVRETIKDAKWLDALDEQPKYTEFVKNALAKNPEWGADEALKSGFLKLTPEQIKQAKEIIRGVLASE